MRPDDDRRTKLWRDAEWGRNAERPPLIPERHRVEAISLEGFARQLSALWLMMADRSQRALSLQKDNSKRTIVAGFIRSEFKSQ